MSRWTWNEIEREQSARMLRAAFANLRCDFPQFTSSTFDDFCVEVLKRSVYGQRLKDAAMACAEDVSPRLR